MPVQVVCPSCSTQLSIRDEHAGRAVKCPKCGSVIPAAAPPAPPPLPPTPAPPPPPSESAARPTAKPAASRPPRDEDDDDRDRPRKKKKPRDDDDDDDDDRPRRREPVKKTSTTPIVLGVLALLLFTCCGGVVYGIYRIVSKGKELVEEVQERAKTWNPRVNQGSYLRLEEGMTPQEVEAILGPGKVANAEETTAAFPPMNRARATETWNKLAGEGRVVIWRNGDDHILCGFYPAASNGKLQMKTWQPGNGISAEEKFASDEEAAKPGWGKKKKDPDNTGPAIAITAAELARKYKDDTADADLAYNNKTLLVTGALEDLKRIGPDEVLLVLTNAPPAAPTAKIGCTLRGEAAKGVWRLSRQQAVTIRGRSIGMLGDMVNIDDSKVESSGPDLSLPLQSGPFLAEFKANPDAAYKKYKDKNVTLLSFVVVRRDGNNLFLTSATKSEWTVKALFGPDLAGQLDNVKPNSRVTVKGEFGSFSDTEITVNRCWLSQ